jgi:biotin carboxyl carrier protein
MLQRVECLNQYLDRGGPICAHLTVLVVEALKLQFEVIAPHEGLVHGGFELEDVVADSQVVL